MEIVLKLKDKEEDTIVEKGGIFILDYDGKREAYMVVPDNNFGWHLVQINGTTYSGTDIKEFKIKDVIEKIDWATFVKYIPPNKVKITVEEI